MYKDDRRIFERFDVDFPVEIKHPIAQMTTNARCCDASASGIGLFTEERLLPSTNLQIQLEIPDGHAPFQSSARIVWSRQVQEDRWHSGLEFMRINLMALRRIFETTAQKD